MLLLLLRIALTHKVLHILLILLIHVLVLWVTTILPRILNILLLAIVSIVAAAITVSAIVIIHLRTHGADVRIGILAGEEAGLGLSFSDVVNHSTQLRRGALTLGEVVQVLEDGFLSAVVELILAALVLEVVELLLGGQGLFELQLLLHFLLLIRQDRMLTRRALRVINRITRNRVHFALLWRVLVRFGVHHHHLFVLLCPLHVELLLGWVHHVVADASDAGAQTGGRVVLGADLGDRHAFVLRVGKVIVLQIRGVQAVLV